MLITARNHDLKNAVAKNAEPEDWIYALVSLQTCEGYSGGGNYGIARMNGGSSSRPMLGLAPAREGDLSLDLSAWWRRDVERLLEARRAGEGRQRRREAGAALVPGVAGRGTVAAGGSRPVVYRGLPAGPPGLVARPAVGTTRNIEEGPHRCAAAPGTHRGSLGARAPGGGQGIDAGQRGFRLRTALRTPVLRGLGAAAPVPAGRRRVGRSGAGRRGVLPRQHKDGRVPVADRPGSGRHGKPARARNSRCCAREGADGRDPEVRPGLAGRTGADGGWRRTVRKEHYSYTFAVRDRFRQEADRLFFESLWRRVRAQGEAAVSDARAAFLADLLRIAKAGLEAALPAMPCPAVVRPLGETRARRRFRNWLWGPYSAFLERELREFLAPEPDGAAAEAARAIAGVLAELPPDALAEARRMEYGSSAPVFWRLSALHPETVGNPDRREEWIAIVRILAVLAEGRGAAGRSRPDAPYRRLGEALCDGGDAYAWPLKYRGKPHPEFSERRLAQLLGARGRQRAALLERAMRALVRSRLPGSGGVDPADVAGVLLAPEDGRRVAEPYFQRLDRARWDAGEGGEDAE